MISVRHVNERGGSGKAFRSDNLRIIMRPAGIIIGGITAEFISERGFLTDLIGRAVQYFIIFDSPASGLVIPALPQTAMIYQIIRQCPERKVPCIPPGSRKIAFAVNLITGDKNSDLLQIGGASDSPGLFLLPASFYLLFSGCY